jgi:hypothetical protein
VAYPGIFSVGGFTSGIFSGGVQQIKLKTTDRENGDLGALGP